MIFIRIYKVKKKKKRPETQEEKKTKYIGKSWTKKARWSSTISKDS